MCRSLPLLACAVILVAFTGACGYLEYLLDWQISEGSLTGVPKELQFVLDNREAFEPTSHPLRAIVPGEATIDAGEGLDGCWGRLQAETTSDHVCGSEEDILGVPLDCGRGPEIELLVAEVLRISMSEGLVEAQIVDGVDGGLSYFDGRPYVQVLTEELLSVGDDRLLRKVVNGRAGLLSADGLVDSDIRAVVLAEVSVGAKIETVFTLDGDFLVTADGDQGMEFSSDDLELWFRFDCDDVE